MNCLEFRRRLLIDPSERGDEFLRHIAECQGCAREAKRAWAFEEKLRSTLGVEAPVGLESRVVLAHSLEKRWAPARSRSIWALAVGLVLSLGLGAWFGYELHRSGAPVNTDLAVAVVDHIEDEIGYLEVDLKVQPVGLERLLSQYGASLSAALEPLRYAGRCRIGRSDGLHLILQGERGPVTVLLLPGEYVQYLESFNSARFSGVLVPTAYGSMAVVGEKSEPLDPIVKRIREAVSWRI